MVCSEHKNVLSPTHVVRTVACFVRVSSCLSFLTSWLTLHLLIAMSRSGFGPNKSGMAGQARKIIWYCQRDARHTQFQQTVNNVCQYSTLRDPATK